MSCFTPVVIKGKEVVSQLQPDILKILKNNPHIVLEQYEDLDSITDLKENHYEEIAGRSYNYFTDPVFIEDFGDWKNGDPNIDIENIYDNGEPKLKYDNNVKKYYYQDKYNDKVYFPLEQNGLNYIFTNEEIQEGTQTLAYAIFKRNFNNDWNDLSFINDGDIKDVIRPYIFNKVNELKDEEDSFFADRLRDSLYYIDEWADNVNDYFKNLGFKIEETDTEIQDSEENDTQELVRIASFEKAPTNSISANIKTFLSFIPDYNSVDSVFIESSFVDFGDIYNTLQSELANLSPTIINNNVEDIFETMLVKIGELSHKKPYFKELLNILNSPSLTDNRKSEFTQAFNLVKNPYFISEVDFKGKNIKFTSKDVSQVNANFNSIKREWGFNFETNFVENGKLNNIKLVEIKDDIKIVRSEFDKLRRTIQDNSELNSPINKILNVFRDLGVETTEEGFNSYIGNLADITTTNEELIGKVNTVLSTLERFTNELNNGDVKVFYKNKFLNPFNTQSLFSDLAKEESFYKPDGSDASIYSSGKSYWVYSTPSYLSGEINKWKSNIEELESLYREPGNESSKVLEYLLGYEQTRLRESDRINIAKNRIENVKLGIFNVFQEKKDNDTNSDPKNNVELSKDDAIIDNMNRILLNVKGENSLFNTPTPADKSTSYLLSHGYFLNTNINEVVDKRAVLPSKVIQVFYDYFSSEYNRMIKAVETINDPNAKKYVHYHTNKHGFLYAEKDAKGKLYNFNNDKVGQLVGNAFKSQIFEGLSFEHISDVLPDIADRIYQDDGTHALQSIDSYETEIKDYIHNILKEGIAEKVSFLNNKNIISPNVDTKGGYDSRGIDKAIMDNYDSLNYPVLNAVSDYYINGLINNIEYSKMFSGDPAYYKNMVDYAKRIPSTYTDGLQLRLLNNDELTFNVAIIAGVEVSAKDMKALVQLVGKEIADMYSGDKVNTTDAQAWITPKRWKFLVERLGLWTKYHDTAYPKMMGTDKTPFTPKEIKAVAQPLKGVYFKRNNGVPTYLKYSQAVLLPDLIQGTDLQRMYDKMVENDIDETITLDGIKVGANISDITHDDNGELIADFNLTPLTLDNRGWKLQQNLPTKGFKNTAVGSQIQKNVLSGLAFNLDTNFTLNDADISGKDLYANINSIVGALSDAGVNELTDELNIDDSGVINDKTSLYKLLLDEAKKRNINENLIKALEKELTIYGIPQSHSKLMNMFMSIVRDRLVKIKTNGGSFIQVSNFGIDKLTDTQNTGVKWFIDPKTGLRPPHIVDVSNETNIELISTTEALSGNLGKDIDEINARYEDITDNLADQVIDLGGGKYAKKEKRLISSIIGSTTVSVGKDANYLTDIIKKEGQKSPILIKDDGIIIEGRHRLQALKNIGDKYIDTVVLLSNDSKELEELLKKPKVKKIIKPGQVLLPGSLLTKYIPNWKDMDAADLKAMISPEILENIIGYRIPNQGLSSNDALEIVGFLPEGMGDAVVAYSEIPTKTGSDFDIDKMYMMIPSFSQNEDGSISYDKPNMDEEGNELPLSQQPKGVLQNKLIESYKAVFLHPDVVKDVMTPIDFDYIKKDINTIFDNTGQKSDLYHFDNINQINLKYDFLAGKAGVGQTANMLVDHVRGMFINTSLRDTNIGWGHTNENNETLFDREYSQELNNEDTKYISELLSIPANEVKKYKIGNSISAFLNAFVDIAKDPYVTRGNWTTQTSNTGFTMLRAGMHPMYVNRFIGQPIIKEYIDFVVNAESKFNNEKGNIRDLFLEYKNFQADEELDVVQEQSLKQLDSQIKNPTDNLQSKIINKFFELQDNSKKIIQSINASKPDVQGAGKDLSSRLITQNLIEEIENEDYNKVKGSLTNFSDKLVDPTTGDETILGHYVNNSIYWIDKVTKANPKLFQMANKHVENTFNVISQQLRGTKLLNQTVADQLYSDYYAYSLSGFSGLKIDSPAKTLFVDLAAELSNEKLEDEDNYFLNQLEIVQEEGINFIRLQNKKRSKGIQNKMYRGWKDLIESNPELGEKLIKYSYYQSGFKNNINEFFSHIPHEYFVENRLNNYIYELDNEINDIQYKFIDQFYRHNANNTLIVPNIFGKQVKVLQQDISYTYLNDDQKELSLFTKFNDNFLKLEGYDDNGNGIYVKTFKLGIEKQYGNIIEYKFDSDIVRSQLGSNNPTNLSSINSYLSTLKTTYNAGEYNAFNNKTELNKQSLTEAEVGYNELFDNEVTNDINKPDLSDSKIDDKLDEFTKDCKTGE